MVSPNKLRGNGTAQRRTLGCEIIPPSLLPPTKRHSWARISHLDLEKFPLTFPIPCVDWPRFPSRVRLPKISLTMAREGCCYQNGEYFRRQANRRCRPLRYVTTRFVRRHIALVHRARFSLFSIESGPLLRSAGHLIQIALDFREVNVPKTHRNWASSRISSRTTF